MRGEILASREWWASSGFGALAGGNRAGVESGMQVVGVTSDPWTEHAKLAAPRHRS